MLAYAVGQIPWNSGIPAPELARFVASHPPGRALDLGCGTGTNVIYLADHGWQATGVDFVPGAIAQARRRLTAAGLEATLLVGDVTQLETMPLPGPFQLVVDIGCFHSVGGDPDLAAKYAAGVRRWLLPGGTFLLYAHQPDPSGGVPGLPREAVEAVFTGDFRLTLYEQGRGRASAWYTFERAATTS